MDVTAADRYPEPDDPILAWLDAALAEPEPPHTPEE